MERRKGEGERGKISSSKIRETKNWRQQAESGKVPKSKGAALLIVTKRGSEIL